VFLFCCFQQIPFSSSILCAHTAGVMAATTQVKIHKHRFVRELQVSACNENVKFYWFFSPPLPLTAP
jgi:hypothetical protein